MKILCLILVLTFCHTFVAQLAGGWQSVDLNTAANDATIQSAQKFGAQYVGSQAYQSAALQSATFSVSQVNAIKEQVVAGWNYWFDVVITDANGISINATYVVYSSLTPNSYEVTSYFYDYNAGPSLNIEVGWTEYNNEYSREYFPVDWEGTGIIGEHEYFNDEDWLIAGGWTPLDPDNVANDADLQSALNFGVQYVAQQGISAALIPDGTWTLKELQSVSSQVVSGMNYEFDAWITDGDNSALANFVVYSQPWTNTLQVTSWSFLSAE